LENENKGNDEKQNSTVDAEKQTQQNAPSIFTREEIVTTVRSFLLAWIKNDIKIHFPTAEEIQYHVKQDGRKIDRFIACQQERDGKIHFLDKIVLVAGTRPATKEQQEYAINELFKDILCYRCGNRIEGTFGKKEDYDARLSRVEEQIEAMNVIIQELVIYYRSLPKR